MTSEDESDGAGAFVLQPTPPRRGAFALLIPADVCWETTVCGGTVRLDFRPRTLAEKADGGERAYGGGVRRRPGCTQGRWRRGGRS